MSLLIVEPMTGIEPAYSAWEADVLPLNYIGVVLTKDSNPAQCMVNHASDPAPAITQ